MLWIYFMSNTCETGLRWMPENTCDDKSTLLQVMACCGQATSHYLSQCWLRCVTIWHQWPAWVKGDIAQITWKRVDWINDFNTNDVYTCTYFEDISCDSYGDTYQASILLSAQRPLLPPWCCCGQPSTDGAHRTPSDAALRRLTCRLMMVMTSREWRRRVVIGGDRLDGHLTQQTGHHPDQLKKTKKKNVNARRMEIQMFLPRMKTIKKEKLFRLLNRRLSWSDLLLSPTVSQWTE